MGRQDHCSVDIGQRKMMCILSVYAPQTGRMQEDKDAF